MKLSNALPIAFISMTLIGCGNSVQLQVGGDEEMAEVASPMITAESAAEDKVTSA